MITINIYYTGKDNSATLFAEEMIKSGITEEIRRLPGCLRYEYYKPFNDEHTILLIDAWESQASLDAHHNSEAMRKIAELREKYDLHMKVERFVSLSDEFSDPDKKFIRE